MNQIQDGRYPAKFTGEVSVYENAKGSLVASFPVEVEGQTRTWFATLVSPDGTVNTRRIADIKAMIGWDGQVDTLDTLQFAGAECEATITNEQGNDGKTYSNIRFCNPLGRPGTKQPESMDRNTLLTKYGAKFRAVAGGAPVTSRPPVKPPVTTPVNAPPPREATANMETCWKTLCNKMEGKDRQQIESTWFEHVQEVGDGCQPPDFTPEMWLRLLTLIQTGTLLPF